METDMLLRIRQALDAMPRSMLAINNMAEAVKVKKDIARRGVRCMTTAQGHVGKTGLSPAPLLPCAWTDRGKR